MAKKPASQNDAVSDSPVADPVPSTDPQPRRGISLAQKIANRLGYGISIAERLLEKADRESLEASIDSISNNQLAERLEPAKKA